jgi:hypothetical protein
MNQVEALMKNHLIIIFLFFSISLFAQNFNCDKIYDSESLTKEATFLGTKVEFISLKMDSLLSDLKPEKYDVPPTSFKIKVTINANGQIIDSFIFGEEFDNEDKKQLSQKLLKWKKWQPAEIDGQSVCSYYFIAVSCILWH